MRSITKQQLIDMQPCDLSECLKKFGNESMNIKQAFDAGFTVCNILWLCGELRLMDVVVEFANGCAERAKGYADVAARYAAAAGFAVDAATAETTKQKEHLMELLK